MSAQQLDNNKIKLGQIVRVANQEKKTQENQSYIAIQIEDENGDNERCILFTEIEFTDLERITFNFVLEKMVNGRLYNAIIDRKETNLIKLTSSTGEERIFRISKTQLNKAEERARKNPEDLTKKNWFVDLID